MEAKKTSSPDIKETLCHLLINHPKAQDKITIIPVLQVNFQISSKNKRKVILALFKLTTIHKSDLHFYNCNFLLSISVQTKSMFFNLVPIYIAYFVSCMLTIATRMLKQAKCMLKIATQHTHLLWGESQTGSQLVDTI